MCYPQHIFYNQLHWPENICIEKTSSDSDSDQLHTKAHFRRQVSHFAHTHK